MMIRSACRRLVKQRSVFRHATALLASTKSFTSSSLLFSDIVTIDPSDDLEGELQQLTSLDFPKGFVDMAHPEDYVKLTAPFKPYFIDHRRGGRMRTLFRVCARIKVDCYLPMTFVVDTGEPGGLYLSSKAMELLLDTGRIIDSGSGPLFWDLAGKQVEVDDTPDSYQPANILGLAAIKQLQLTYKDGNACFLREFSHI